MNNFTRSERISLNIHPTLNEQWVQGLIAADPPHVRFTPKSGHRSARWQCPLCANSGSRSD